MPIAPGPHRLGPENATLSVLTGRSGAAAKAGHDLTIHVTSWTGSIEVGDDGAATSVALAADATSLRVREGKGGMQALGDDDVANIHQTIDDQVLKRQDITFTSTAVEHAAEDSHLRVRGDLTIVGATRPIDFDVAIDEGGAISATAVVKQSEWGMKPYSALFGALKVSDEVRVVIDGHL